MGNNEVRLSEKLTLSVEECAILSGIGINKLRDMIAENDGAPWVLRIGNRTRIKRVQFEKMLSSVDTL